MTKMKTCRKCGSSINKEDHHWSTLFCISCLQKEGLLPSPYSSPLGDGNTAALIATIIFIGGMTGSIIYAILALLGVI